MILQGRKRRELNSLDEIFGVSDEFGLLNVKPRSAAPGKNDLISSRFEEINQFIDQRARLPFEHGESLSE